MIFYVVFIIFCLIFKNEALLPTFMAEITEKLDPILDLNELYETPKDILGHLLPLVPGLKTKELVTIVRIIYSGLHNERYQAGLETPSGIDTVIVNNLGSKAYLFTLDVIWPDGFIYPETWYIYDKEK